MQLQELPRMIYILFLLYAVNGQPIEGRTRLEKLVFLISQKVLTQPGRRITSKKYTFRADRFGPFSEEVYDDFNTLLMFSLVEYNGDKNIYKITNKGNELVNNIINSNKIPISLMADIENIKKQWNNAPLNNILKYVYKNYEEYTVESEIRDKVLR